MQYECAATGVGVPERSVSNRKDRNRAKRKRQRGSLRVAVQNHLKLIDKQGFLSDQDKRSLDAAQDELFAQARAGVAKLRR